MIKKNDLPSKICIKCKKSFLWRKKWKIVWKEVRFCSLKCKREWKLLKIKKI